MKKKEEKPKEESRDQYFAPNDVNITARIEDGRTTLIYDIEVAEKVASDKRSYHYPVKLDGELVGYGVPK